jgi:hypothetical protein
MPAFSLSPDDIRCESLMARRNYHREHLIAPLERRLDWLKEFSFRSWPWMAEERQQVESEIAETQNIIAGIEAEIRAMGKNADIIEGVHMDENYRP